MTITPDNLFALHDRGWRENRYVYPVISRRSKGLSIGINLNPDKACDFDCVYCQVDRRVPPVVRSVDLHALRRDLSGMLDLATSGRIFEFEPFDRTPPQLRRLDDVAFSGDGEPTACPVFLQACELVIELLEARGLGSSCKVILITNATLLRRPSVANALTLLHRHNAEFWAKLDAGTQSCFHAVARTNVPLRRVLDNILHAGRRHRVVIQTMLMCVHGEPTPSNEIQAIADRIGELQERGCQIKLVQLYTVARPPAEADVTAVPASLLNSAAEIVRRVGVPVECFPADSHA